MGNGIIEGNLWVKLRRDIGKFRVMCGKYAIADYATRAEAEEAVREGSGSCCQGRGDDNATEQGSA